MAISLTVFLYYIKFDLASPIQMIEQEYKGRKMATLAERVCQKSRSWWRDGLGRRQYQKSSIPIRASFASAEEIDDGADGWG